MLIEGFASHGLLALRLFMGLIFLYHGFPKFKTKSNFFKLVGIVEVIAALALIAGFYTDVAALAMAVIMLGALYHKIFVWKTPFSTMKATGWEFDLVLLGSALVFLLVGPGTISYDYIFGYWP